MNNSIVFLLNLTSIHHCKRVIIWYTVKKLWFSTEKKHSSELRKDDVYSPRLLLRNDEHSIKILSQLAKIVWWFYNQWHNVNTGSW